MIPFPRERGGMFTYAVYTYALYIHSCALLWSWPDHVLLAFAGFVCLTLYLSLQGDVRFKIASLADEHKGWFDISHENNGFDPDVPLVGIINRVFEERHAPKTRMCITFNFACNW